MRWLDRLLIAFAALLAGGCGRARVAVRSRRRLRGAHPADRHPEPSAMDPTALPPLSGHAILVLLIQLVALLTELGYAINADHSATPPPRTKRVPLHDPPPPQSLICPMPNTGVTNELRKPWRTSIWMWRAIA